MNRKGITTIELLLCFIIVMIITVSMYATVAAYNNKRLIESYKEQITNYKNTITKDMQDDFIKIGVSNATYERTVTNSQYQSALPKVMAVYTVNLELRDGSKRKLVIEQTLTKSSYHPAGYKASGGAQEVDDYFMIKYGDPDSMIEYKLPDLGSYKSKETGKTAYDFSINNVLINIYDEKVLSIYIGFYHPEFGTRYFIDVTALVDFSFTGAEFVNQKKVQYFILWNLDAGSYTGGLNPNPRGYDQTMLPLGPFTGPKKDNYTFTGWTGSNGNTADPDYVIPRGTTGSLSFKANYRPNRLIFRYKLRDGESMTPHTEKPSENKKFDWTTDANGYIMVSINGGTSAITQHTLDFDKTALDLNNYNNTQGLNISKTGYKAVSTKEWKCLRGCLNTNVTINQAPVNVTPSTICNYKDADCIIDLGVNWTPIDYTITYDYAGGNATNPETYTIATDSFTLNAPTRAGYRFTGWSGTDLTGSNNMSVTISKGSTGNRSYTAHWEVRQYTVSFNNNGGSGTMSSITCNHNADCTLPTNAFTAPTGYSFGGWYTATSGGTKKTSPIKVTADTTLYVHWALTEKTFDPKNSVQSYTPSATGTYKLEVWGAQGGNGCQNNNCTRSGGKGGYSSGNVTLTEGVTIYVVAGTQGGNASANNCTGGSGGYNGGAKGANDSNCDKTPSGNGTDAGGGGGGASHIAKQSGQLKNISSSNVYIVAGGGGGGGYDGSGGSGGGSDGTRHGSCGYAGNQSGGNNRVFGAGTTGTNNTGAPGGGGGGWYGGVAGGNDCPGPGGSGYIGGVTGGSSTAGQRSGGGYAKITFVSP